MIHVKHFINLFYLLILVVNIYPAKQICPVHNISHKHSFITKANKSFQTISAYSEAQLGDKFSFPVINFTSGMTENISAEVHKIGEILKPTR